MKHEDDFLDWKFKVEHRSSPPLRWIANLLGQIGGWAILHLSYFDKNDDFGIKYKMYSLIYKITYPVYYKYGTFYVMDANEDYA